MGLTLFDRELIRNWFNYNINKKNDGANHLFVNRS